MGNISLKLISPLEEHYQIKNKNRGGINELITNTC